MPVNQNIKARLTPNQSFLVTNYQISPGTIRLGDLFDIDATGTTDGAMLLYNATVSKWVASTQFTNLLKQVPGTLTASAAIVVDANSKIDRINVGNITITGSTNTISSTNTNGNIVLTPNGTGYVTISGTNGLVIPVGTTIQRNPATTGAIRYNTTTSQFEGYAAASWSSLGGVRSVDGFTLITAESTPGASDDILHFYAGNVEGTAATEVARLDVVSLRLLQGTAATSTTSGSLVVTGGAGISKDLYVGGTRIELGSSAVASSFGTPNVAGNTAALSIATGSATAAGTSGAISLVSGDGFGTGASGTLTLGSGASGAVATAVSGAVTLKTGNAFTTSGILTLSTGGAIAVGNISIAPGISTNTLANNAGNVTITGGASSGNASTANAGNVTITGGSNAAAAGVGGNIVIDAGSGVTSKGTVTIGGTNASAITIGASGISTTINGTLVVGLTKSADASGTNAAAPNRVIQGGANTGNSVAGGYITFGTSTQLTSGTTVQTITERMRVEASTAATTLDLTTAMTTANLFNTGAATINFGGAGTAISIGASTGTLTIGNPTITGTNATAFNMNGASPSIATTSTATASVFNTNATTGNLFGAATAISIGASTGTLTIGNPTITGTNATTLNLNGASPSIVTSSTATASVFNTNALTGNLFGAATAIGIGASTGTITLGNPTLTGTTLATFNMNGASPSIVTSSTATASVFNTNALTGNLFGAATAIGIGASTGTLTIGNPTITGTNATTLNLNGTSPSIVTTSTGTASVFNTNALTGNLFGAATTVSIGASSGTTTVKNNLVVSGNLTVDGTTSTVNSNTVTIDDPIITLGGDTSVAEITKDRGVEFKYGGTVISIVSYFTGGTTTIVGTVGNTAGYAAGDIITISGAVGVNQQANLNGTWKIASIDSATTFTFIVAQAPSAATYTTNIGTTVKSKNGFFGLKQSTGRLQFIPQANNTSEVFTGTLGDIEATNFRGALVGNADTATKWATARTITLGGDLTGNVSIDGSTNVTLTATVAADSVALGTDTTGNYVASVAAAATPNGIVVTGTGESATVTVAANLATASAAPSSTVANTTVYIVYTLGTTSLAQWQSFFSGLSVLPSVGQLITSTAAGTLAGVTPATVSALGTVGTSTYDYTNFSITSGLVTIATIDGGTY